MSDQVVWVGSYGNEESRSYSCVRWTAEECMAAMQADWEKMPHVYSLVARLEFTPNDMAGVDRELAGYAPAPHPRWEADISFFSPDGQFESQFVYIEPFPLPTAKAGGTE